MLRPSGSHGLKCDCIPAKQYRPAPQTTKGKPEERGFLAQQIQAIKGNRSSFSPLYSSKAVNIVAGSVPDFCIPSK